MKVIKYIKLSQSDILKGTDEWYWYHEKKYFPLGERGTHFINQTVANSGGNNKNFRRPIYKKNIG